MAKEPHVKWSRRERQIMEIIYQRGQATAADVLAGLPDPPSYSAVRALLRILEDKGQLKHAEDGGKYVYAPTHPRANAGRQALQRVVKTFYDGSLEKAVAALMDARDTKLSAEEAARLRSVIEQARQEGR